jgi:hypothetical protein
VGPPQPHAGALRSRRRLVVVASVLLCVFVVPAMSTGAKSRTTAPPTKVRICHATSSNSNPYVSEEPAIANNGDLSGGHLNHTGPVFPADGWGDIIPPYTYVDENGKTQTFPGYNWTAGEAIYQNSCEPKRPTPTRIVVVKSLSPSNDPGKFNLKVDGNSVVENIGDGGRGETNVTPGTPYEVSETAAGATKLADYRISSSCTTSDGQPVGTPAGASVSGVTVAEGKTVTCLFTNTRDLPPDSETVTPRVECVLFRDGQPDTVYWGYNNKNGGLVTKDVGPDNTLDPPSANAPGAPPETFLEGDHADAFTTEFDLSAGKTLTWSLTGQPAIASSKSASCNATATTIMVQKVTVPANDPGRFNLLIDNKVVATGGHGTKSDQFEIGPGEATVRETEEPGTNLADYTSKVECTNGTATRTAEGTKLDGEIKEGDRVVCTFTNTRKGAPPEPPQPLPPTPPDPDPDPIPPTPPGPAPRLDLVVTKSVEPDTVAVGGRLTWTMIVTNQSSVAAADVNALKVNDRSFRTRLISLNASQGTCRPSTCNLGRLAPGASARITAVTEATQVGVVVNIVRVSSEEQESNYRNNVAAAIAQVVGRLAPPVVRNRCDTLTVAPRVLQNRRSSVVVLTALNGRGRPVAGIRVRVRGPGVDTTVTTDRRGTVRRTVLPRRAGLFFFTGVPRTRTGGGMHCRTLLGVLGASDTRVTG